MIYSSRIMTLDQRRDIIGIGSNIDPSSKLIDLMMEYSDNTASLYVNLDKQIISESSEDFTINDDDLTLKYAVIEHTDLGNTFFQVSNQIAIIFLLLGTFDIGIEPTIEFRRGTIRNIVTALNNTNEIQEQTTVREVRQ